MHITQLRIRNYRNFLCAKFHFKPGVNTLIGENGSGKTNVFQAMRILLDENLERNSIYLREADFCRALGDWRGHWIVISADFADLDSSEGCQNLRHSSSHVNGTNTGTCTYYFRPKKEIRQRMCELWLDEDAFARFRGKITINDYEAVFSGRAAGDCLNDEVYKGWVGNFDLGECPDPDQDDSDSLGVRMQPVYQEVACTFVRALRDVIGDLRGFRGNPLLNLLRGMEKDIQIESASIITQQVRKLNDDISGLDEIKSLSRDIEGALKKAVGHTYGPNIGIDSSLPDSMDKLLQRLGLLVGETSNSDYKGELHEQSLGVANLIYLSLKLLEYERKLSTDRVAHFFLIEEPEAHIHTHIQKTLFGNLPSEKTQVIVSTHSTHISSAAKIESVNILAKRDDYAEVYQPSNGLSPKEVTRVERYLDAIRSTLLFAKGVLLTEGDAELIVIPAMLRRVFGVSSDELGFSLISMNSAFFEHISLLFAENRIKRPCAILTDGDASFNDLPENAELDTTAQASARAAEASGALRRAELESAIEENSWVRPFFAENTFEVDFIKASNVNEIVRTLDDVFVDASAKARSKQRLESENLEAQATEVLRVAEKVGKGWFAVLLAEQVDFTTYIPSYILEAIAFACHKSISDSMLRRMAEFRVTGILAAGGQRALELQPLVDPTELSAAEYVEAFLTSARQDDFNEFLGYVRAFQAS